MADINNLLELQFRSNIKFLDLTKKYIDASITLEYIVFLSFFGGLPPPKKNGVFGAKRRFFFGFFGVFFGVLQFFEISRFFLEFFLGFRREAPKNAKNSVF